MDAEQPLVAIAALASLLAPLNSTMIAVALPDIGRALAAGPSRVTWLVTSYLIAMAVAQPVAGSLGDLVGRRRIFPAALCGFGLASVGAALASDLLFLTAFRTGQALAGAMAIPNAMALIRERIPSQRRGAAFGVVGSAVALAAGVGPPLGGVLVQVAGWRAIFWVNIPLVAVTLAFLRSALARAQPVSSPKNTMALPTTRLDLSRVGTLSVMNERRMQHPIVRLELFRRPGLVAASATVALGNLTLYSLILLMPQLLTSTQRRSSLETGLILGVLSLPLIALSPSGGRLADRWGRRGVALAGGTLAAGGLAPFLGSGAAWSVGLTGVLLALIGCGLALTTPAVQAAAVEAIPESRAGQASGVFSACRYLGGIAGSVAVTAALGSDSAAVALSGRRLFALFVVMEAAASGSLISSLWLSSVRTDPTERKSARA